MRSTTQGQERVAQKTLAWTMMIAMAEMVDDDPSHARYGENIIGQLWRLVMLTAQPGR